MDDNKIIQDDLDVETVWDVINTFSEEMIVDGPTDSIIDPNNNTITKNFDIDE